MSELIKSLPRNSFEEAIRQAERITHEIKSRQRLSNIGGQLGYLAQTANTWDVEETFATTPPFTYVQKTLQLTYTADGKQSFPMTLPFIDIRVNGTADVNRVDYLFTGGFSGELGYVNGSNILFVADIKRDVSVMTDPLVQRWTMLLTYQGSITLRAKGQVMASSDGTVELVRL
ncbi:hypothetical protein [Streptomyces sp. NPDC056401]|uniref:hypothetical protein n=1 Tax=Streptomyces sp. NPDC056401 TaxID=3345809 RepID=UPI0035D6E63D